MITLRFKIAINLNIKHRCKQCQLLHERASMRAHDANDAIDGSQIQSWMQHHVVSRQAHYISVKLYATIWFNLSGGQHHTNLLRIIYFCTFSMTCVSETYLCAFAKTIAFVGVYLKCTFYKNKFFWRELLFRPILTWVNTPNSFFGFFPHL